MDSENQIAKFIFGVPFEELSVRQRNDFDKIVSGFKGYKELNWYSWLITDWYGGGRVQTNPDLAAQIIQKAPVLKKFFPYDEIPETLYRGLTPFNDGPQRGQRFFYLSRPPRLLSGWTSDIDVARKFTDSIIGGRKGFLLIAERKDVLSCATPVLWPETPLTDRFEGEQEWVLHIKKPMPIEVRFEDEQG